MHTIDISISDEDWADLKANPLDKTKYTASVTIDGEEVDDVSFATKGNTSLSSVASDEDSDRYSFKINFGKNVDGQTYRGLDKLNLNNLYADATYMKDYLSYEIFRAAGADAPLTSYVQVKVNGEDLGLYLAIEDVDSSYLDRTHEGEGELYKPETEMLGNMDKVGGEGDGQRPGGFGGFGGRDGESGQSGQAPQGFSGQAPEGFSSQGAPSGQAPEGPGESSGQGAPEGMEPPEGMELPEGMEMPEGMNFPGGFGGFGGGDSGASLKYTDDELSSYSDIFDNAETKVNEEDEQRVVAALKNLSEGNAEAAVNTDEVIRYFAAHNFVMSYDSYTGSMLHNYYLYENDGKLEMIPWDYNLAFGAFGGGGGNPFSGKSGRSADANSGAASSDTASAGSVGAAPSTDEVSGSAPSASAFSDATATVNCGIDTPLSGAEESDRPMWAWISSSDEYLNRYHEVYDELLTSYFESGECQAEIERVRAMIAPYVESDSPAFYTYDEFNTAVDTLEAFVEARAQSIRAQLNGTLSTKMSEQDESARIDASGISISAMGSQGGGRR